MSLPHGPVLGFTLHKINDSPPPDGPFHRHRYISERRGHEVALIAGVANDQREIRDYSHTLPEWRDPNGSSLPIAWRDILLAEGLSDDDVRDVEEGLRAEEFAGGLLS